MELYGRCVSEFTHIDLIEQIRAIYFSNVLTSVHGAEQNVILPNNLTRKTLNVALLLATL